jgi:hypothetical protein
MLGTYCHWGFNYQEGRCWEPIVIGDSIIKRGDVGILLSLEIQLSRGEMLGTYCDWRFNYQEGRVGILLSLEIQLSRGESCDDPVVDLIDQISIIMKTKSLNSDGQQLNLQ